MAKKGKEKIISTSFQLFLKDGYNGVSIKNIMDATQLSKGAIYHHFDSKHAIYMAALEEYFFKMLHSISTEDDDLHFVNRIKLRYEVMANTIATVEQMGKQGNTYPIRTFFMFQLESEKDKDIRNKIKEAIEAYRKEIISIVQLAIDRKEIKIKIPADIIAYQIISMVEGLAIHHSTLEKDGASFLKEKYEEVIQPYLQLISTKEATKAQLKSFTKHKG